jgi:hypothetical protein
MAMKREIEVVIGPNGAVSFEVKCVKGDSCMDLTKALEERLGEVVERERTPEFYQEEVAEVEVNASRSGR